MGISLAQQIAELPPEERAAALEGIDPNVLLYDWSFWARTDQLEPVGDWRIWLLLAGRGAGKTRAASEWIRDKAMKHPGCRIGLVGRTAADVRDVMILGVSGIMSVSPPSEMPEWKPSTRTLTWPNGSTAQTFSAEAPDQLRGPAFHFSWGDETAAWQHIPDASGLTAWNNLEIATREGDHPKIIMTTTPKRVPLMYELMGDETGRVAVTRARTKDNVANLSEAYTDAIYGVYAGTALAAQELEGLLMDDVDGALWTQLLIDNARNLSPVRLVPPLRCVGVDPSVAEAPKDECGIVVVGSTNEKLLHKRHAFVLEDLSMQASPEVWARAVVDAAKKWGCPIVVEKNQGHHLVTMALRAIDPTVKIYPVNASVGKKLRAEPVVLPYEQGRVHHWGYHPLLESQMTTWDPENSKKSPDRLDALVHGITALLVEPPKGWGSGPLRAKSLGSRKVEGIGMGAQRASRMRRAA